MKTILLYRGPLDSCNYACDYCPFARRAASTELLREDGLALERFVDWVERSGPDDLGVQFTPRGEALIHPGYQDAIARLSRVERVRQVAIQTNLSCDLDWVGRCEVSRVGLWCSYHPRQVSRRAFLDRCRRLDEAGVAYSVGMVGRPDLIDAIAAMRDDLPEGVYLWVNAYKSEGGVYRPEELARLTAIDPLFGLSAVRHVSRGRPCLCGQSTFAVDGRGDVRRCHFVPDVLGNLYADGLASLRTRAGCPRDECTCHIGYIHMPELDGEALFGEGILARVPRRGDHGFWRQQ